MDINSLWLIQTQNPSARYLYYLMNNMKPARVWTTNELLRYYSLSKSELDPILTLNYESILGKDNTKQHNKSILLYNLEDKISISKKLETRFRWFKNILPQNSLTSTDEEVTFLNPNKGCGLYYLEQLVLHAHYDKDNKFQLPITSRIM